MVDTATGYPLHPQEDVETPPGQSFAQQLNYADAYQPPAGAPAQPPVDPQPVQSTPPIQAPQTPSNQALPPGEDQLLISGYSKPIPEETIVDWEAPSRPFKKRTRQYFTTIAVIVLLVSMILFFAGQFLPIAVVISVAFLAYVLSVVPPSIVSHSITTYGLRIEGNLYYWDEMGRYWFTEKYGQKLLHIEIARFPGRITVLLGDISEKEMDEFLSEILINQKPTPTFLDKAADWIQEKIPLESDKPAATPPPPVETPPAAEPPPVSPVEQAPNA
jgi:hypothetical protein